MPISAQISDSCSKVVTASMTWNSNANHHGITDQVLNRLPSLNLLDNKRVLYTTCPRHMWCEYASGFTFPLNYFFNQCIMPARGRSLEEICCSPNWWVLNGIGLKAYISIRLKHLTGHNYDLNTPRDNLKIKDPTLKLNTDEKSAFKILHIKPVLKLILQE